VLEKIKDILAVDQSATKKQEAAKTPASAPEQKS